MLYKYYDFENFDISYIQNGWYLIDCKPLGKYLYNIDSVEISKIPKNIRKSQLPILLKDTLNEKKVIPKKTNNPESFFKRKQVPRLMIFLTASCNLNCIYCHCNSSSSNAHIEDNMLFDGINKYIDYFQRLSKTNAEMEITFMGGGEPFVRFEKIKEVVLYLENKGLKAKYVIVTNGTLGTDDDWQWLLFKKFSITISADGPPKIQNLQRLSNNNKNTSQILERRLLFLDNKRAKINIRSTVLDSNKKNIDDICKYFESYTCIKTHQLEPISYAGRGEKLFHEDFGAFYRKFFKNFSKYLYSNPSRYKSAWFKPFQKSDGFCGAVYHNAVLTHDGYISLCTEVDSKSLNTFVGEKYIVSNINDLNPFESLKAYQFTVLHKVNNMVNCKECIIRYKCGGGCYVKKDRDFNDDYKSFYDTYCKNIISMQLSYLLQVYDTHLSQ